LLLPLHYCHYCLPPEDGLTTETVVAIMTEKEEDYCVDGIIVKLITGVCINKKWDFEN
jgi:hypothetical protein